MAELWEQAVATASASVSAAAAWQLPADSVLQQRLAQLHELTGQNLLLTTAAITAVYQLLFFAITVVKKFDKVTDFAGGSNFALLALAGFFLQPAPRSPRQVVLTALVLLWSARLALFLLYRILLWGKDSRFDDKRESVPYLAFFWTLQALWVWTVSLPLTFVNSGPDTAAITASDHIAWAVFAAGLLMETIADFQKLYFKQRQTRAAAAAAAASKPAPKAQWCTVGLWRWSRHPNYFAEIALWWASLAAAAPTLHGAGWWAVAGPLFITLLLLFLSGLPLLERSNDKRFWTEPAYQEYKRFGRRGGGG